MRIASCGLRAQTSRRLGAYGKEYCLIESNACFARITTEGDPSHTVEGRRDVGEGSVFARPMEEFVTESTLAYNERHENNSNATRTQGFSANDFGLVRREQKTNFRASGAIDLKSESGTRNKGCVCKRRNMTFRADWCDDFCLTGHLASETFLWEFPCQSVNMMMPPHISHFTSDNRGL